QRFQHHQIERAVGDFRRRRAHAHSSVERPQEHTPGRCGRSTGAWAFVVKHFLLHSHTGCARLSLLEGQMDIPKPSNVRRKRIRRAAYGLVAIAAVAAITLGLSRLKPAPPSVDKATVWIDTVKRGPLLREVRGLGTLVPEDIRWIPATTQGRVERILLHAGTRVKADSTILELVNPELDQELQDAQLKAKAAEASLQSLRVQ